MALTLRQLEIFAAAAAEEHFGRAAERLMLSQPAVSKEVRNLERSLRTALFVRGPRGVTLTDDGHHVATRAADILTRVRDLESMKDPASSHRRRAAPRTVVTVAASPSVVDGLLPRALSRADTDLPGVDLRALEVDTGAVASAVLDGRADVGLGHFVDASEGLERVTIAEDAVVAVIRSDHPAAGGARLDLADIGSLPLLIWSREVSPAYYDFLLSVCESMGPRPRTLTAPLRLMGAHSYLLTEGRAFGLFPEQTAARIAPGLAALPLRRRAALPLDMVWRRQASEQAVASVRRYLTAIAEGRGVAVSG